MAGDTQTSYLATIAAGIAPDDRRAEMVSRVVKDVQAHGNHLTTGFLGTPFLLNVLDENDRSDVAFQLLLSDTYPSWGYMVKKGATTWWERWNGDTGDPGMNSYNHYAFGSVMAWVYRRAAGIDTDATGPGFHHLTIRPHFDVALPKLHVEYDSVYGTIISDWKQSSHRFSVTIPPNTTANVILPGHKAKTIGSGTYSYAVPRSALISQSPAWAADTEMAKRSVTDSPAAKPTNRLSTVTWQTPRWATVSVLTPKFRSMKSRWLMRNRWRGNSSAQNLALTVEFSKSSKTRNACLQMNADVSTFGQSMWR